MHWFYYVGRLITRILLLLTRCQVTGKKNIPRTGHLLIVANHISLADPPVLGVIIRRRMMFFAKEELFQGKFTGYFIRNYGALPVKRGGLNRKALAEAERWLAQGMALVMFPEGGRSPDRKLQPAFPGSALLASRLGAPILPVGITGTEVIRSRHWYLRRPRITVNIGEPFLPPAKNRPDRTELAQFTKLIMEHIADLLPPEHRREYEVKSLSTDED